MEFLERLRDKNEGFSLDEFVIEANRVLPKLLPEEQRSNRQTSVVSPRLIRNLATLGLIDEALREGREARYGYRHFLQLLVSRVLMAKGYTTSAVKQLIGGASDEQLESVLGGDSHFKVSSLFEVKGESQKTRSMAAARALPAPSSGKALEFLKTVKDRSNKARAPSPPPTVSIQLPQYTRIPVRPGLELHIAKEWQLPPSSHEREVLMEEILDALKMFDGSRRKRR